MLKRSFYLTTILGASFLVSGCMSTLLTNNEQPTQDQLCIKMKRQLIYQQQNLNHEATWTTKSQREKFKKHYQDKCGTK